MHILIAEDNEADVFLIRECLESAGLEFDAEIAPTGERALSILDRHKTAADGSGLRGMIVDLNLTTHSGFEILSYVREAAAFRDTLVVILTSSDSPEDRRRAKSLGADAFFRKPLELGEFMQVVQEIADLFRGTLMPDFN